MRYVSTRGGAPVLEFDDALLAGLAADGGLYVPATWPAISIGDLEAWRDLSYAELAVRVISPFLGGRIGEDDFAAMVEDAYAGFDHPDVAPLKQLEDGLWLMELFHGPTLAFKDYPMQLLGRLFDHVLGKRGERVTILVATSGDTGSAAIEACRGREAIDAFILYPHERVTEVQRRQMTTVAAPNVHAIAIEGTFDDCQDLVKAMFNDRGFRDELRLSAMNSINWGRVMAQTVYYVRAALGVAAPGQAVAFSVPSGNFGNVFAGYAAREMGLPVDRLVVASNVNDILTRFFEAGDYSIAEVRPTLSPSMDIQISSNFERLLYDLYDRDGAAVAEAVATFRETGRLDVGAARWQKAREVFTGCRLDDEETKATIREVWQASGELLDPHSAIGVAAARAKRRDPATPMVALATAHPGKFAEAVEAATGSEPELPPALAGLAARPERVEVMAGELGPVQDFIRSHVELQGAA